MRSTATELLLLLMTVFPVLEATDPTDKNSPFYYDWESLRLGGLICAGVLCFLGIAVLISGKCKRKPKKRSSIKVSVAPRRPFEGGTSEC